MIRILIKEPSHDDWPESINPFVKSLTEWKVWCEDHGLQHLRGGSHIETLEPGQWCIKSYRPGVARSNIRGGRHVCFNPADRHLAIMFKLEWT